MNRAQWQQLISEMYGVSPDYPWAKYPSYAVFRHTGNRKWFALFADVPKEKLGLSGKESLDVLNVKCDPLLIGSLRKEAGFFPAYHMNKASWISIALDGTVSDETIQRLLDLSYTLTGKKEDRYA